MFSYFIFLFYFYFYFFSVCFFDHVLKMLLLLFLRCSGMQLRPTNSQPIPCVPDILSFVFLFSICPLLLLTSPLLFLTTFRYQVIFVLLSFLLALMSVSFNNHPVLYALFSAAIFAAFTIYSCINLPYPSSSSFRFSASSLFSLFHYIFPRPSVSPRSLLPFVTLPFSSSLFFLLPTADTCHQSHQHFTLTAV